MTQPLELYYWPTPNGYKVTIALEEMALPYVVKPVDIGAGDQFKPEFLKISPNNRMPAMVDPEGFDGAPVSMFESGAILQYLVRKTGRFGGDNPREQAEVESWLMWQMGGLGPMAGQTHHFLQYAPKIEPDQSRLAYGQKRYTQETARLYGVLNTRLADRDFVAGALSIADFAIWPWIMYWRNQGQDLDDFPHVKTWYARCREREAFQKGRKVGEGLSKAKPSDDSEAGRKAREVLFGKSGK